MRFRHWLSVATVILLIVILVAARGQFVEAWFLLWQVNIWILLLLIPVQFISYFAESGIFFTYLRARGQLKEVHAAEAVKMALELNFVNDIFPSGNAAGISYLAWRLSKFGVPPGQTTMAEIMRYMVQISTFIVLLIFALLFTAIDNNTSNWLIMVISIAITAVILIVFFGGFLISKARYMKSFARWLTKTGNFFIEKITFGRVKNKIKFEKINKFFKDFREDFLVLKSDKKLLIKPIVLSFVYNISDMGLFFVTFWALGSIVSPAILFIGYAAAALAGTFMPTPGGAGAYELIMVGVLVSGGVSADIALAGVVLARAVLVTFSVGMGFFLYQAALNKYGKPRMEKIDLTPDDEIERIKKDEK